MIKLAVIVNRRKLSGKLTRIFTGCYAYHSAWVDLDAGKMYDMHLIRRRRPWPHYTAPAVVHLFDVPGNITRAYLEDRMDRDTEVYGFRDYMRFGARPLYHLLGATPPNAGGVICSEMTNSDIWACGGETPWPPEAAPPSPCDQLKYYSSIPTSNPAVPAWPRPGPVDYRPS